MKFSYLLPDRKAADLCFIPLRHWPTIVSNLRLKMRIGLLPSFFVNTTKWQKKCVVRAPSLLFGKILARYLHRASPTLERVNMTDYIWPHKNKNRDNHLFLSDKSKIRVTLKNPRLQANDTSYRENKYIHIYKSFSPAWISPVLIKVNGDHWLQLTLDVSHDLLVYIFRLSILVFSSTGLMSSPLL